MYNQLNTTYFCIFVCALLYVAVQPEWRMMELGTVVLAPPHAHLFFGRRDERGMFDVMTWRHKEGMMTWWYVDVMKYAPGHTWLGLLGCLHAAGWVASTRIPVLTFARLLSSCARLTYSCHTCHYVPYVSWRVMTCHDVSHMSPTRRAHCQPLRVCVCVCVCVLRVIRITTCHDTSWNVMTCHPWYLSAIWVVGHFSLDTYLL